MRQRPWILTLAALLLAACAAGSPGGGGAVREVMAPTGALRVALFEGNAVHALRSPSGELRGVAHDMGAELARRLGVPFTPVVYTAFPALLADGKAGAWDVAFLGVNPERRGFLDFTEDYLEVEVGYLVPADVPIATLADVDRPGVRIAVVERGSPEALLAPLLRNASLVRVPALGPALQLVTERKAEAIAGQKPAMFGLAARLPGSKVLEGSPARERIALAMPKGRGEPALAYAASFVEQVKRDGTVARAVERASLRGVAPAR